MKKYTIYQTTNELNNKIYVGFHGIKEDEILYTETSIGSIFADGYLGSGKLITRAIEKYGKEAFSQKEIQTFDNKKDAEALERKIVNEDFVNRSDTYNLSIGGNVCILMGENNGFYGKDHSEEFKKQNSIRHKGNKYFSNSRNFKIENLKTGEIYLDFKELIKSIPSVKSKRMFIYEIGEGNFRFLDEEKQNKTIEEFNEKIEQFKESRKILSKLCSERFAGIPLSESHKKKISIGVSKWIIEHPEEHKEKMLKINTSPEKIRKTSEKHTGMKRTEETCKKISESLKGKKGTTTGKIGFYNPETKKIIYLSPTDIIPLGFIKGSSPKTFTGKKMFYNGIIYKLFFIDEVPTNEGWVQKGRPKKYTEEFLKENPEISKRLEKENVIKCNKEYILTSPSGEIFTIKSGKISKTISDLNYSLLHRYLNHGVVIKDLYPPANTNKQTYDNTIGWSFQLKGATIVPLQKKKRKSITKTFIAINHNTNESFIIDTGLHNFCEKYNLSFNRINSHMNKGIIGISSSIKNQKLEAVSNCTGWEFKLEGNDNGR